MLKTLCFATLLASTVCLSPASALEPTAPTIQPSGLRLVAMHKPLPWCSANVKTHCRHHAKAPAKTM